MKDLSSLESYSSLNITYQNRNFPEFLRKFLRISPKKYPTETNTNRKSYIVAFKCHRNYSIISSKQRERAFWHSSPVRNAQNTILLVREKEKKNSRIRCWSDFSKLLAYQNLSQCLTKLLRKFEKNRHIIFLFCFSFSFFFWDGNENDEIET